MAYKFVYESEAKRYRSDCSDCSDVLKETCELLKEKDISAQFSLIESGARNMITRNGEDPYDLDYNLLIMKAEERCWNDLRLLKETVRNALNRAERRDFFSDVQDSTSCLTALLHFKDTPNVEFSFDVANIDGQGQTRLTVCLSGAFCPFSAWRAPARPRFKEQKSLENTSLAGAAQFCRSRNGSRQGKTRRAYACMAKGFDEAWAHFCPSKPCLPLSIDVNLHHDAKDPRSLF